MPTTTINNTTPMAGKRAVSIPRLFSLTSELGVVWCVVGGLGVGKGKGNVGLLI